jgi:hypothetical protein
MDRRLCRRRSGAPSGGTRPSSAVRFTRRATFWRGCRSPCTPRREASCGKPGNWITPRKPKSCCAISRAVSIWEGVAGSILEGIDETLTLARLALPRELRRSLACANIIENVMGAVRRVCRNVKHWSSPSMAMRWTAAAMMEAKKGFRRLKAHKQLPALRAALDRQSAGTSTRSRRSRGSRGVRSAGDWRNRVAGRSGQYRLTEAASPAFDRRPAHPSRRRDRLPFAPCAVTRTIENGNAL